MKKVFVFSVIFLTFSCSVKKNNKDLSKTINSIATKSDITKEESNIIANFLEIILKDNRYKNYPICIMKEGISKLSSLVVYEYCYVDRNLPLKNSTNKDWILNEAQIKSIKDTLINSKMHYWEVSDFTTLNVSILESNEVTKSIKENTYTKLPKRLLIYLSVPLIIDENNVFMSFRTGDSFFGFKTIDSYTALLRKNKDGKWEIDSYYYDPNSTW